MSWLALYEYGKYNYIFLPSIYRKDLLCTNRNALGELNHLKTMSHKKIKTQIINLNSKLQDAIAEDFSKAHRILQENEFLPYYAEPNYVDYVKLISVDGKDWQKGVTLDKNKGEFIATLWLLDPDEVPVEDEVLVCKNFDEFKKFIETPIYCYTIQPSILPPPKQSIISFSQKSTDELRSFIDLELIQNQPQKHLQIAVEKTEKFT